MQTARVENYSQLLSIPEGSQLNINWHPRQWQAFTTDATELLFGGASEGGKSHFIRIALINWCAAISGLQCFVFRKYYNDVIRNHMEGETPFPFLLRPWVHDGLVKITEAEINFWNGSRISLAQLREDKDFEKAQGILKHVLVFDEATQIKERHIKGLRGWVRMSREMQDELPEGLKGRFPRIIYTANPIGESVSFFRRTFVKARAPYAIEKVGAFTQEYIPSRVEDNPSADPIAQRERLESMGSQALADALIMGNWDAPIGDFFKEYNDDIHSVPDFTPPSHWFKFRTFDWGSSEPFVVYWWCVSDGDKFTDSNGLERQFPRGSLIAYREWYGCDPEAPAKGIGMRNEEIAKGIIARSREQSSGITLTDNLPFQDRGMSKAGRKYIMADTFFEAGCPLTLGNTSRVYGWKQLRDRLIGKDGFPLIYFCESCVYARDYIPALPVSTSNPEDAVDDGEATHAPDAIRLACTARPLVKDMPRESERRFKTAAEYTPAALLAQMKRSKPSYGRRP